MMPAPAATPGVPPRHPLDPDPVRSTQAVAVFWLAVLGLVLSPVLAGAVPATVAMVLAAGTRAEMRRSEGFLTGVRYLTAGVRLARIALFVAAGVLAIGVVVLVLNLLGSPSGPHYGPGVD